MSLVDGLVVSYSVIQQLSTIIIMYFGKSGDDLEGFAEECWKNRQDRIIAPVFDVICVIRNFEDQVVCLWLQMS